MSRVVADALAAGVLVLALATSVGAQPRFFSQSRFALGAAAITNEDDPRFAWDADFIGAIDLIDYETGRVNVTARYETVLGNELRAFDPNQGNYTLEVSVSGRAASHELGLVLHHVSRHLSDRRKDFSIDWNILGARYLWSIQTKETRVEVRAFGGGVVRRGYVDYRWMASADLRAIRPVRSNVALLTAVDLIRYSVDRSRFGRSTPIGGGVEAGARLMGEAGGLELFARFERRIDPDPLEPGTASWVLLGFRFVNP